ncbi:hypothetical protein LSUE1_G002266 [Lachnellula suecica]|uniref:Uncharacterized protein n=1 Tax=Lachnellula suecica TaxID=602035 RepID=A0A8T9CGP9_9HELO|nr:hypothetical protein LSUE1_G002266 [Lachnellula suecica]
MTSLRSGTVLKDSNKPITNPAKTPQASTSKKRKAQEEPPIEDNKENVARPATPPAESKFSSAKTCERTPGRVGPIKEDDRSLSPDIKPFKGTKGQKVRKTAHEKNEEYRQFARENEGHMFHELYVCFDNGPKGSPTYDKSGFELDYHKVAEWMKPKPYNKSAMMNGMDRAVERARTEEKRMAEIFFEKGEAPADLAYSTNAGYWKDRVSKDLNVPWHKVGVPQFEEWEKKGFKKARRGEYENFSEEDRERQMRLLSGASLRK